MDRVSDRQSAESTMEAVGAALRGRFGFVPTPAIRQGLLRAAQSAAEQLEVTPGELLHLLASGDARAVNAIADHGLIGETYFFRCPEHWQVIAELLRQDELGQRESLRLWSAGCASGEEPYSLAIALIEAGRAERADCVLGTDASSVSVARARAASYSPWSLRQVAPGTRAKYFETHAETATLCEKVRRKATFAQHNLLSDDLPLTDCDLILCRNVLIYFDVPTAEAVLSRLMAALRPGGFLLVGPSELPLASRLPLERIDRAGTTFFRRPPLLAATPAAGAVHVRSRAGERQRPPPPPRDAVARPLPPGAAVRARAHAPGDSLRLAKEAADRGRLEDAERLAREAAATRNPEAHVFLAIIAEAREDLSAALVQLRSALYLQPDLVFAHVLRASVCRRLGDAEQADLSRRVALQLLSRRSPGERVRCAEELTAGALLRALQEGDSA